MLQVASAAITPFPINVTVGDTFVTISGGSTNIIIPIVVNATVPETILFDIASQTQYFPSYNTTPICNVTVPACPEIPACPNITVPNGTIITVNNTCNINQSALTTVVYNNTYACPTTFTCPESSTGTCPACPPITCDCTDYQPQFDYIKTKLDGAPQTVLTTRPPDFNATTVSVPTTSTPSTTMYIVGGLAVAVAAYFFRDKWLHLLKGKPPESYPGQQKGMMPPGMG